MSSMKEPNNSDGWDPVDPFDVQDPNFWVKIEHLGRYLFAADYLQQYHPDCVVDVACGRGYGITELCRVARRVIGVDNSPEMLEMTAAGISGSQVRLLNCDLDNENLVAIHDGSPVDAIVSFETLEHLINPAGALMQFTQLLRPEGILICSVPNVIFESRDRAGLPENKYHKQFFNYNSLSKLLKQNGFEVTYRIGQSWPNIFFKRQSQLIRRKVIDKKIIEDPCLHSPEMIRFFSYVLAYPTVEDVDGSYSIIIVAQKLPET